MKDIETGSAVAVPASVAFEGGAIMGLFQRISDIISANFNEMAERYEDPEKMLKQAIREMECSIRDATQETARAMATEKRLVRELAHNQSESRQWQSRAEVAVESGDDDLARKALGRKQEHDKLAVAIEDQLGASSAASRTLRHQLDGMQAKLSEARRNLGTLVARKKAAEVRKKVYSGLNDISKTEVDESAFDKFERLRERVEQAEAEAEALAELQGGIVVERSWEAAGRSEQDDIESQLSALKRNRRG